MEDIKARLHSSIHLKFLPQIHLFFKISNGIVTQCINKPNFTLSRFTLCLNTVFNNFTLIIFYIYITYYRAPKLTTQLFQFEPFYNLKRSQSFFHILQHHCQPAGVLAYCLIFLLYILVYHGVLLYTASKFTFSYHKSVIFK